MLVDSDNRSTVNLMQNNTQHPKSSDTPIASLREQIAQKFIIDLRYYCEHSCEHSCRTPVTELPTALANVITETSLGGVILFSDNLTSADQTIKLTYDLQQAAKKSRLAAPLFITVDQEGGRVFRTARDQTTAFTGNMAIGATYQNHGIFYAEKSAEVIAKELKVLGFNVNHAPTVDVNANPENPVINVRAYGEDPRLVTELGLAQLNGFQQQNMIGTLKHFPGHGDTATDSHTGLPRVEHDIDTVNIMDIGPYKSIFKQSQPGMVMTAHIQYPNLDSSTFVAKDGRDVIKPATMSRKIITDILRGDLGYQGVVVTDAMDMAGISHFFDESQAIISTFKAGVDIAVMGVKIRTSDDLHKLSLMIDKVVAAVECGELDAEEVFQSYQRIHALKAQYKLADEFDYQLSDRLALARQILAQPEHRALEEKLAIDAITQVTGKPADAIIGASDKVHLIMPDKAKAQALESAIKAVLPHTSITLTSALSVDTQYVAQQINDADVIIGAHISPRQSAAEMGGMDDLETNTEASLKVADASVIYELLASAKKQHKRVIFVSLRTPYEIAKFSKVADATLATYSYNTYEEATTKVLRSPALEGLVQVLSGRAVANGSLPVTVKDI